MVKRRNRSYSKLEVEVEDEREGEKERDSEGSYQYQPDAKMLKKEIVYLRTKFEVKKHEYRKEIEDLKRQIILW